MLIISLINWVNLGHKKLYQHQIPKKMNYKYSKGDIFHGAQVASL